MLRRLLATIALLIATLSAPAALSAKQHAVADGCFPPVEAPRHPAQAPLPGAAAWAATDRAGAVG
jgi:hypothetical protein